MPDQHDRSQFEVDRAEQAAAKLRRGDPQELSRGGGR